MPACARVGELLGALDAAGVAGLHAHADRTGRQRTHRQRRCSPLLLINHSFGPAACDHCGSSVFWRGSALSGSGLLSADFVGDKVGGCGQLDINGNRFVDPKQRPQDYDDYNDILVNLTAAANDLLPAGAPKHAVLRYTDNYASTGDNDSTLFADSWVTSHDGIQQVYSNCTKPGGPIRVQMKVFFADGISSYSKILDEYFALSFKMGASGIFHE